MIKPKIKICGITNIDDGALCIDLGVHMLGFIFYPKSPRWIEPELAGELIAALRKGREVPFKSVGVVVNPTVDFVQQIIEEADIDMIQFHGDESPEFIENFSCTSIKAFRVKDKSDIEKSRQYDNADYLLFDTYDKNAYGGTGKQFNWDLLDDFTQKRRLFLSGGLGSENILEAVEKVRPFAIDISSSLESAPGKKDHGKVREFFRVIGGINKKMEPPMDADGRR